MELTPLWRGGSIRESEKLYGDFFLRLRDSIVKPPCSKSMVITGSRQHPCDIIRECAGWIGKFKPVGVWRIKAPKIIYVIS